MKKIKNLLIKKLLNYYLPFVGAGIKIKMPNDDFSAFDISMKLTRFNKNYVGVHYGGSLYSMCDPFYMLILMHKLGRDYIVWDKSASVDFLRPGTSKVYAEFRISDSEVENIKEEVQKNDKYEPVFEVYIKDENNKNIAKVTKRLWVKKKDSQI